MNRIYSWLVQSIFNAKTSIMSSFLQKSTDISISIAPLNSPHSLIKALFFITASAEYLVGTRPTHVWAMSTQANDTATTIATENKHVTHVRVVTHLSQDHGPGDSENHWSIYLLTNTGGSVRLNMTTHEDENPEGRLEITSYKYPLPNSALRHWDYALRPGCTFRHIHDLLLHKGRTRFRFSGGGSGCRFWWYVQLSSKNLAKGLINDIYISYTVMRDLEENHYIALGSCENLFPKMEWLYFRHGASYKLPWVPGEFY